MNVRQHAKEGIRKAAAKSSRRLERKRNAHRRFHNHVAGAFACEIQNRSLAREQAARRRANHGCEAAVAPGLDAFVAEICFVGPAAPGAGCRTILWPARLLL